MQARFGTDGLRGRAGEPPLDPKTLRLVGASLGLWLQRHGSDQKRVLIGNDGRDSSSWIAEALAQGLASTECSTTDVGLTTTPALSFLTRTQPFSAGVMISASHNAAEDNGLKIFQSDGDKLPDDAEREIESLTGEIELGEARTPRTREDAELLERYLEDLGNTFADLDLSGATVVVDAANGGGSYLAPAILRRLGADVVEVACEPDGTNINAGCGALHPDNIVDAVKNSGAVVGVCLDGDGDRCIFVDDSGAIHDGDSVLATLGPFLASRGELPGNYVVATIMSNLALRRFLTERGIRVEMTPVGDRHVSRRMRERGFALGGEQSGHVLFDRGDHLVGDGVFTALTMLSLPGILQHGAGRTFASFARYPQVLINVPVASKPALDTVEEVRRAEAAIAAELGEDGRVVLRYSGTENLCRVMVEGPERAAVEAHARRLADVARVALS